MSKHLSRCLFISFMLCFSMVSSAVGFEHVFGVRGDQITINDQPFKAIGLRCSNALISNTATDELIGQLDTYTQHGINIVSVFVMGSRFGDLQGYRPDGSIEPEVAERLVRVIRGADKRGMVVVVGCLYWSTSEASEKLQDWKQADAELAVANTARLLVKHELRNVFIDVDNEGMAHREKGFDIAGLIDAVHRVDRALMVAYNNRHGEIPKNADLYVHHSPRVSGRPWLDSEATPQKSTPGGYWGKYSKESHQADKQHYNYSRIGRYTPEMKREQIKRTIDEVRDDNGHMLASTWLQAGAKDAGGIDGPRHDLGGNSEVDDINADIDQLHPDAGVRWWADFVKAKFGRWDAETLSHTEAVIETIAN